MHGFGQVVEKDLRDERTGRTGVGLMMESLLDVGDKAGYRGLGPGEQVKSSSS